MKIANIETENLYIFWMIWEISMKLSGKMWFMIMLKAVTQKQRFTPTLEDTFLGKRQGQVSLTLLPPPSSLFRVKVSVSAFMAYSLTQSQLFCQFFMVFL